MSKMITVELIVVAEDGINTDYMLDAIFEGSNLGAEAHEKDHGFGFRVLEADLISERDMNTD